MQNQIDQLKMQASQFSNFQEVLQNLHGAGLIKQVGSGAWENVNSYEEHQQLAAEWVTESQATLQEVQ